MRIIFALAFLVIITCTSQEEEQNCIYSVGVVEAEGCGNLFVYHFLDSTRALTVTIANDMIPYSQDCQTFDLSEPIDGLSVTLEIAGESPDSIYFNYCNDVGYINSGVITKTPILAGKISFQTSVDEPAGGYTDYYTVSIKLKDLVILNGSTQQDIPNEITFVDVGVGWMPG